METSIELSSGYKMPVIGLGTCLVHDPKVVKTMITEAIQVGYRFIDTAFGYMNQDLIGENLKKLLDSGKVKREDLFIVDKLPNNGMRPENVEHFFEKSRAALQLDYIDLYLIHSPISTKRTDDDKVIFPFVDAAKTTVITDSEVDLCETWKAMEELVRNKRVRSLGMCNFNKEQIKRIYDVAEFKPAVLEVECHAYLPQYDLQTFCKSLGIYMCANCPVGTPDFPPEALEAMGIDYSSAPQLLEEEIVKQVAKKYKKSPAQILLKSLVQRGIVPIPKGTTSAQIKENFEVFNFTLDEEDVNSLKKLERDYRYITLANWKGMADHKEYPFKPVQKSKPE